LIEQNRLPVSPSPERGSRIGRQNQQDDSGLKTISGLRYDGFSRSDFAAIEKYLNVGAAVEKFRQIPRNLAVFSRKTGKHGQHGS
jgi:hypothetical protein